jgi:RimJ/RimL family protein N-acetyltransferase
MNVARGRCSTAMSANETLRSHAVTLRTPRLVLRPMTESDWPALLKWNQDPRVLEFWDAGKTEPWSLDMLQRVYRGISRKAYMFIIELAGKPIGEGWVQEMNLPEIRERFPGKDLRRIDLSIGEPSLWGRGLGTEAVGALVRFGFEACHADALFACHVSNDNPRSRHVFEHHGFGSIGAAKASVGSGSQTHHHMLARDGWHSQTP